MEDAVESSTMDPRATGCYYKSIASGSLLDVHVFQGQP